ncbi:solute carrier family 17 member 9 isoform X7 [Molossus molossus]|uniref:solute carrier family 17 member 9 isoform X7 n=1 Tax=Molossus molossus TaxID=27622 RepID=UPI0017470789|nr:solute carrier family 17 member 9 isoform X7 [Molossus molossus]
MQPPPDEARRDPAEDTQWSRPECQAWTGTLLLGTCLLYCARVSMPVCTVSMSQDFGWNKKEAGIVLSSFFWGYCLTQIVGGHLGDRVGGEKVILLSASAWGLITAATPLLAHLGSAHLVFMTFSRILTGLLQGVYFPALTSLLSQKVRESERAFTYSTVGAGSQFGTLVTGAVGSLLLDWYGWQSVFYLSGGLTLLWVCYVYRYLLSEQGNCGQISSWPWAFWRKACRWPRNPGCPGDSSSGSLLSGRPSSLSSQRPAPSSSCCPGCRPSSRRLSPAPRLQNHRRAEVHAGDGTGPVQRFRPVFGSHLELLQVRILCVSLHRPADLQPQVWPTQRGPWQCRCCGRGPGWLPDRDHGLLDVRVQPGGRHQQPGAVRLPDVRQGPAGGPESRP